MKNIDEFVDSSDDESIVQKNPYLGIEQAEESFIKTDLIRKRLAKLTKHYQELATDQLEPVQFLLKNSLNKKKPKSGALRKTSNFTAPLAKVKEILDGIPSNISEQHRFPNSIIPSYRGIMIDENLTGANLFYFTRNHFEAQHHFSNLAYKLANVDRLVLNQLSFYSKPHNLDVYKSYQLNPIDSAQTKKDDAFDKVKTQAQLIQHFFSACAPVELIFEEWCRIFPDIRKPSVWFEKDEKTNKLPLITLKEILSYIYTSNYKQFIAIISDFSKYLAKMQKFLGLHGKNQKQFKKELAQLQDLYQSIFTIKLDKTIPYLSEGQIPRHALLYAFDVKRYQNMQQDESVKPFYKESLKPYRAYLGKFFIAQNPSNLFRLEDAPLSIVEFDKKYGGRLIEKTIIGEREFQHFGANLQGTIQKSINIKLPKFNKDYPKYYKDKYGLDEKLFVHFKQLFQLLSQENHYGKLSWLYLEAILFAHLIHFHEIQAYKYSAKIAEDLEKELMWSNREEEPRESPFNENISDFTLSV